MDQKRIGSFLKELRKEKGLIQEQIAENLNVSGRTISRWETGNNMPDISVTVLMVFMHSTGLLYKLKHKDSPVNLPAPLKYIILVVVAFVIAFVLNMGIKLLFG